MPAGMIHMVETQLESGSLGANLIHRAHLLTSASSFRLERKDEGPFSSCYPEFPILALNELMVHLWLESNIKLINFCRIK